MISSYDGCSFQKEIQSTNKDKLAVALVTEDDKDSSDYSIQRTFEKNFSNINGYQLKFARTKDIESMLEDIKGFSKIRKINSLIQVYHGDSISFDVKSKEEIDTTNAEKIFKGYSKYFAKDATIILYSCSTGEGKNNLAEKLSKVFNREVIAPRVALGTQETVPDSERINEFKKNSLDQVVFDYKNFELMSGVYDTNSGGTEVDTTVSPYSCMDSSMTLLDRNGKKYFLIVKPK